MKTCKKCNLEKELEDFVKSSLTLDGTISTCKECLYKRKHLKRYEVSVIEKICSICSENKKAEDFPKNAGLIGGLHCYCKTCSNKKIKESQYYKTSNANRKEKRKSDPEYRIEEARKKNDNRKKNILTQLLRSAKKRAVEKSMEFSLIKEDIIIPEKCPVLGIDIFCGTKGDYGNSPSLDRINNSKGYVKNNIQVISMKANTMKNSATPEELLLFSEWINKTFKNK